MATVDSMGNSSANPWNEALGLPWGMPCEGCLFLHFKGRPLSPLRFDGALHEFSTLPGVVEDVTDIILNLKAVRLKMQGEEPRTIKLNASKEGLVRAKDLICDPQVEVLNPDLPIATLSADGQLKAEMKVKMGKGYVPSERNKVGKRPDWDDLFGLPPFLRSKK